ncbi:metallophosphoesterase family protein [Streptomyces liangshanensis]|uniref:Metallophosphoesterase n=1 Tax=Streptomyces liangshanensis TaxID=2717324 RepID=A0A6G9H7N3_9ACTN|nr:metallophosphoesterase [Streptomyces liangshanensis]QIQ06500.1 metallophosphoesterase [Streptomyces liangshanensis]
MSPSSRDSAAGAGWHGQEPGQEPGHYRSLMPERTTHISWLNPVTLWKARNGVVASLFGDPTGADRQRWVRGQLDRGVAPDLVVERDDPDTFSFMLLADTGEGDAPQYAVVPGFLKVSEGTRFAVLSSDVIYPVGSGDEYGPKFFRPYQDYPAPIYAVPGNHDWYDGLNGFMRVLCDAPALPPAPRPAPLSAGWWRALLWRRPGSVDERLLAEARRLRSAPEQRAAQPGPYWAVDAGPLRIIGIDTGLLGDLDREQGEWLRRVSAGPRPKVLVTGSPIYVDGAYKPCAIEGGGTVDDIVRDPACHYIAAIGGDIHNYQHYPVDVDGRTLTYLVSGGGGAFMHATHTIPRVAVAGVTEDDFRCYPLRGDSLAFYSRLYGRRLRMRRFFELTAEQAAAVIAERLGVAPTRETDAPVTRRTRLVASLLGVPGRPDTGRRFRLPVRKIYAQAFSPGSTTYTPPFFKSFLRLDVTPDHLRIRCFAATGHRTEELAPPVEDDFTIPLR